MAAKQEIEEDYMSNIFIEDEEPTQSRKRPCHKIKQNTRATKISRKAEEGRIREEGLSRPLTNTNRGYEMLRKMGYEPGLGLGKSGSGRLDPIPLKINEERQGIGRKTFVVQKEEAKKQLKADQVQGFHQRQRALHLSRQVHSDLAKCQAACEQLDSNSGIEKPQHSWFWKSTVIVENDSDDEDQEHAEIEADEKLQMLTSYLCANYFFCTWCGVCYKDKQDLENSCPGNSRSDHET